MVIRILTQLVLPFQTLRFAYFGMRNESLKYIAPTATTMETVLPDILKINNILTTFLSVMHPFQSPLEWIDYISAIILK